MVTTIQISEELKKELSKKKFSDRETYENIIWDLLEDTMELNEKTKKEIGVRYPQFCQRCGRCVDVCPFHAPELKEVAPGLTAADVQSVTEPEFKIRPDLKEMQL